MYQDQDTEYYESESYAPANQVHGKKAVYTVLYFLIMAVLMVPMQALHAGMPGVLAAMAIAGIIFGIGWLVIRHYKRKLADMGLTPRQWFYIMMGFTPTERTAKPFKVVDADGTPLKDEPQDTSVSSTLVRHGGVEQGFIADRFDENGMPTRFVENEPVCLAENFQPSIHSLLGATVLMIGKRRSGKSNGMSVFFEELARYVIPFVLFDTEGEYDGLVAPRHLPRGILVCSEEMAETLEREHSGDGARIVVANIDGAFELGRAIMDGELQAVVNLSSFDDEEAAWIMIDLIEGMYTWEQERRNDQRIPVIVGLDEAAKWFPQNAKSPISRDATALLQRAFFDVIVGRGGKRGFGLITSTRKYSIIDKRLLESTWKLLFQETEDIELKQYEQWGIPREATLALKQGECFMFNHLVIGFRLQLRRKYSPDFGATPGLNNLIKHSHSAAPLHAVIRRSYTGIQGRPEQVAMLPAPQEAGESNQQQVTPTPRPQQPSELDRALEAWNRLQAQGITPSGRKLAAALGVKEGAGNRLMNALKAKGLIAEANQTGEQQDDPDDETTGESE
jgi:hypothetical protein